jgi:hypothetical protein
LADVSEGERAQEHPQRGGGAHLIEQPRHPTVAQQVHVADRVRARDHPRDQREDLRCGVRTGLARDAQPVGQQLRQPAPGGQGDHRRQACARHEIRIIEPGANRAASVG